MRQLSLRTPGTVILVLRSSAPRCGRSEDDVVEVNTAGTGPPVAQSSSSTVCTIGMAVPLRDLRHAADIAGGDHVRPDALDIGDLAGAQRAGDLRLQDVVGAGRAAADVALRHVLHREARLLEERFGSSRICWPCCIEQAEW